MHFLTLIFFFKNLYLLSCRPGEPEGEKAQLPVEKKAQSANPIFTCGRRTDRRNRLSHSCCTPHSAVCFLQHSSIIKEKTWLFFFFEASIFWLWRCATDAPVQKKKKKGSGTVLALCGQSAADPWILIGLPLSSILSFWRSHLQHTHTFSREVRSPLQHFTIT